MTPTGEQLSLRDAYLRGSPARVVAVDAGEAPLVVLDRTVFYPGGGGQPSDRGLLLRTADGRSWTVRAARKADGEIVHELEPDDDDPPAVGDLVEVDLDWARRLALMRTHTALHALCGVVWRDYGALVTGGNMEPGSGADGLRVRADVGRPRRRHRGDRQRRAGRRSATSGSPSCRATRRSPSPT